MAFGITDQGFILKRIEDIKEEVEQKIRDVFGESVKLDDRTPYGQLVGIFTERESLLWELSEDIYNSQYPDSAEGVNLDNVSAITGSVRKAATKSTVNLDLFGTQGTIIPAGSIVSKVDDPDVKFATDIAATIAAGIDEQQTINFAEVPESGSFTLEFNGEITAAIAFSAVAADIKTALESLINITLVTVTGSFSTGFLVTFQGVNSEQNIAALTIASNTLTSAEQTQITCIADVAANLDRTYFRIDDQNGSVGVWIDVDDSGSAPPAGALALDRQIEVTGVVTNDTANDVAIAVAAAISGDAEFSTSAVVAGIFTVTDAAQGTRTDASDGDTGFSFLNVKQGFDLGTMTTSIVETVAGEVPKIVVAAQATVAGATAAPASSLTIIESAVVGWDSVNNALDAVIGTDIESDPDFKLRRLQELAIVGRATPNAVVSKILEIDAVTAVVLFENDDEITDARDIPAKSLLIVVQGGADQDIGDEIWDVVAAGIKTIGGVDVTVVDNQGDSHTVKFSRPTEVDIYVEVTLTTNALFPTDGLQQVEDAILAYGLTLQIGQDVIVNPKLICAFATISGITDSAIRISTAVLPTVGSSVVTFSDDAGELQVDLAVHGLLVGNRVQFSNAGGALPTGIAANTTYTIVESNTNDFRVSLTRGGDAVTYTDSGTGTNTLSFGGTDDNIIIEPEEIAIFDSTRTDVVEL